MLPILNRPLLEHLVRFLERQGVEQVFIAMDCEQELPSKKLQKVFPNLRVEFRSSELPLGGGGWLLSLREELGEGPFLVLSCNSLPGNLEVTRMVAEHCQSSATLTLCLEPGPTSSLEGFSLDAQRRVEGFVSLHLSAERRASYQDQGIYLVNRVCFDFINPDGYFDLREQLVAKVTAAGHTVHGHVTPGAARLLRDVDDYFNANLEALQGQDQITVGKDSRISPTAVISGPVLMGDNCLIEDRAVVIGPAVIGDDCVLREGSEIRECVLWTSTEVEADCSARWCVTARPGLKLETRKKYSHQILTADPTSGDLNLTPRRYCLSGLSEVGGQRGMSRHKLFLKSKRAMDLALTAGRTIPLLREFLLRRIASVDGRAALEAL
ncbi:NDP-sugar synthase, partial [bacterium CPR1]|nr:NDP-sugar synthase [bacterium CPR1]